MMRPITSLIVICCWPWTACGADVAPQTADPPKAAAEKPTSSLDDELLRDLESELSDDDVPAGRQLGEKPRGRSGGISPPKADGPAGRSTDDLLDDDLLDNELMRDLEQGSADQDENAPLTKIGRAMREVEELVGQAKVGKPTQEMQDKIVADLDQLLEAARKRQRKSSSSSSSQSASRQSASRQSRPGGAGGASDQPAQDSSSALKDRSAARPDPAQMQDLLRDLWGHLPEHERQMVINSTIEQFLPKYELLIEAYFKRLAEQTGDR